MTPMHTCAINPKHGSIESSTARSIGALVVISTVAGCQSLFTEDYLIIQTPIERVREIESIRLEDRSESEPVSVDDLFSQRTAGLHHQ